MLHRRSDLLIRWTAAIRTIRNLLPCWEGEICCRNAEAVQAYLHGKDDPGWPQPAARQYPLPNGMVGRMAISTATTMEISIPTQRACHPEAIPR